MAKSFEKFKARKLRKSGKSIKEIAKKLNVSPGSVSNWCRDIILTPKQIKALEIRHKDPYYGKRQDYLNKIKKEKELKIERLKRIGISEIGTLSKRELFLVGASLYWAEGFKKDNQVGLASSDPKMIQIFMKWLTECCGYKNQDIAPRITININHKYRIDEIQQYWSKTINIPTVNFHKPFYQKVKWKKEYNNPQNYYGVLRIRVRKSTDFLRKIHGYIEGLKKQV